jgi:hypothetical protein
MSLAPVFGLKFYVPMLRYASDIDADPSLLMIETHRKPHKKSCRNLITASLNQGSRRGREARGCPIEEDRESFWRSVAWNRGPTLWRRDSSPRLVKTSWLLANPKHARPHGEKHVTA